NAYAELSTARLTRLVGVKGECCIPGLKTLCDDVAPFACTSEGLICDHVETEYDRCAAPTCKDSDKRDDKCGADAYGEFTITLQQCIGVGGAVPNCEGEGDSTHGMFVNSPAPANFMGCGGANICGVTSGIACQ